MRRESFIEQSAKRHGFCLKQSKRQMVWEHEDNHLTVITPMPPSDRRSPSMTEKRFQRVAKLPKP